jgi:hypothetical protein
MSRRLVGHLVQDHATGTRDPQIFSAPAFRTRQNCRRTFRLLHLKKFQYAAASCQILLK